MAPEIKGVLCDLDGTLVDTEPLHAEAWTALMGRYGVTLPPRWLDRFIGIPDSATVDSARENFPELRGVDALLEEKYIIFRELVAAKGAALAFPGVADRLAALQDAGMPLAVGTNSRMVNTRATLEAAGLDGFFPVVVTLDLVERGKPEPDIYLAAARGLGLAPETCAVIEDSAAGVAAGKEAGCLVLGVLNTWPASVLAKADFFFAETAQALTRTLAE